MATCVAHDISEIIHIYFNFKYSHHNEESHNLIVHVLLFIMEIFLKVFHIDFETCL